MSSHATETLLSMVRLKIQQFVSFEYLAKDSSVMKRLDVFLLLVIPRLHPKTLFVFIVKIFDIADKFILPVGTQNLKWITSFLIYSSLTPFLAIKTLRGLFGIFEGNYN